MAAQVSGASHAAEDGAAEEAGGLAALSALLADCAASSSSDDDDDDGGDTLSTPSFAAPAFVDHTTRGKARRARHRRGEDDPAPLPGKLEIRGTRSPRLEPRRPADPDGARGARSPRLEVRGNRSPRLQVRGGRRADDPPPFPGRLEVRGTPLAAGRAPPRAPPSDDWSDDPEAGRPRYGRRTLSPLGPHNRRRRDDSSDDGSFGFARAAAGKRGPRGAYSPLAKGRLDFFR